MGVQLTKDSIDLGIVVRDAEAALAFYRDTLGLDYQVCLDMPGGMKMHRLLAGTTVIKIVTFENAPEASAPPGGLQGATGYRYWTLSVSNLEELTKAVEDAGYKILISPREIRPGISISMFEDPEGNVVELLQEG